MRLEAHNPLFALIGLILLHAPCLCDDSIDIASLRFVKHAVSRSNSSIGFLASALEHENGMNWDMLADSDRLIILSVRCFLMPPGAMRTRCWQTIMRGMPKDPLLLSSICGDHLRQGDVAKGSACMRSLLRSWWAEPFVCQSLAVIAASHIRNTSILEEAPFIFDEIINEECGTDGISTLLLPDGVIQISALAGVLGGSWFIYGDRLPYLGQHDPPLVRRVRDFLVEKIPTNENEKFILLDVGANTGSFSMLPKFVRGLEVHAFEPNPLTHKYLRRNVEINYLEACVSTYNFGIGESEGVFPLYSGRYFGGAGLATFVGEGFEGARVTNISVKSLDMWARENQLKSTVVFIKVDVEGGELGVLRGAQGLLERDRPAILLEGNDPSVSSFLLSLGYTPSATLARDTLYFHVESSPPPPLEFGAKVQMGSFPRSVLRSCEISPIFTVEFGVVSARNLLLKWKPNFHPGVRHDFRVYGEREGGEGDLVPIVGESVEVRRFPDRSISVEVFPPFFNDSSRISVAVRAYSASGTYTILGANLAGEIFELNCKEVSPAECGALSRSYLRMPDADDRIFIRKNITFAVALGDAERYSESHWEICVSGQIHIRKKMIFERETKEMAVNVSLNIPGRYKIFAILISSSKSDKNDCGETIGPYEILVDSICENPNEIGEWRRDGAAEFRWEILSGCVQPMLSLKPHQILWGFLRQNFREINFVGGVVEFAILKNLLKFLRIDASTPFLFPSVVPPRFRFDTEDRVSLQFISWKETSHPKCGNGDRVFFVNIPTDISEASRFLSEIVVGECERNSKVFLLTNVNVCKADQSYTPCESPILLNERNEAVRRCASRNEDVSLIDLAMYSEQRMDDFFSREAGISFLLHRILIAYFEFGNEDRM